MSNRRIRNRSYLMAAAATIAVVSVTGAAMSTADSQDPGEARAMQGDGAVAGSAHVARVAADKVNGEWGLRLFRNERGEKCADVGVLLGDDPTVRTPSGRVRIPAGQDGTCAPASSPILLSARSMPDEESPQYAFYGTVDDTVDSVTVEFDGVTRKVRPSGEDRAILTLLPNPKASSSRGANNERLSPEEISKRAFASIPTATLVFKDGSTLGLKSESAKTPPVGSQAARMKEQIDGH